MPFTASEIIISQVTVSDAESIARCVEVPATQNGPLYRTMFPRFGMMTEVQRDEIKRWYIEVLEDAFQDRGESFLKAHSIDGTPVGFCGWTIIERNRKRQIEVKIKENSNEASGPAKHEKRNKELWVPEEVDIDGWTILSKALRIERDRVLMNLDNICRKLIHFIV